MTETWRKSSYSGGQGNCIEVGTPDGTIARAACSSSRPFSLARIVARWKSSWARSATGSAATSGGMVRVTGFWNGIAADSTVGG